MMISAPSKFVPSLFYSHSQEVDDFYEQPSVKPPNPTPFKPIENVIENGSKNSNGKQRLPKVFINISSEEQSPTKPKPLNEDNQKSKYDLTANRNELTIQADGLEVNEVIRKSNLLFQVEIDTSSNEEEKTKKIQPDESTERIFALPPQRDLQRLCIDDSSNSSEENNLDSSKIEQSKQIKQITPKDISITKGQLFERVANGTMRCLLRRDKKSTSGFTQYNLYLQSSLQHILTVRKEGMCQYCFYSREKIPGESIFNYTKIATMESNFLSNKYTLLPTHKKNSNVTICYQTNIFGLSGPRKFFVYLPKTDLPFEYLHECYEDGKYHEQIEKCVSRTAKWNQKVKSYVLNFQGRAKESSIKNFVVTDRAQSEDSNFVIFGKAAPEVYNLDIQSPFSIIQGAAVALTTFERKLTCD